ncbi:MAG: c-type cytochrome [Vicinamibacterales bacterium]
MPFEQVRTSQARRLASAAVALAALTAVAAGTAHIRAQQGTPAPRTEPTPGRALYEKHCVECHGAEGRGDGPAALTLMPRPRDFTSGRYKIRSTETGSLPTDADLVRSVTRGLPGSAMPGWQGILPEADIAAVVQYVKTLSPRFSTEQPEPIEAAAAVPPSPESTARGASVYATLQCSKCHGEDGRGTGAVATHFTDDWGAPMLAANLAEPWTFRGGATAGDIYMRFRAGISGTPMPSYKGSASDRDMWDLANYVASMRRTPVWEMSAAEVTAFYTQQEAEYRANPVKRGEYLVNVLACPICHSPADGERRTLPGMYLAGGLRLQLSPFGTYPAGNLTSDKETGLGNWTDEEIKRVITKGILRDGTRMLPFPMDWASFSTLPASDLDAIVAYLRTVPPVRNKVPRLTRTPLPQYLWSKFQMLMLGADIPSYIFGGNSAARAEAQ